MSREGNRLVQLGRRKKEETVTGVTEVQAVITVSTCTNIHHLHLREALLSINEPLLLIQILINTRPILPS